MGICQRNSCANELNKWQKKFCSRYCNSVSNCDWTGKHLSEEHKDKIRQNHILNPNGAFCWTPEKRKLFSESQKGEGNYFYGHRHSEESKRRIGSKCLSLRRPTKPERMMDKLLDELFPGEFSYVGNGEVWLGKSNPDFININGKKLIIEVFGNYWHQGDNGDSRIAYFAKYGYRTLVVWEKDIYDDRESVVHSLMEFARSS